MSALSLYNSIDVFCNPISNNPLQANSHYNILNMKEV